MSARAEVDWATLDKRKFFVNGVVVFSSLTTCLFPLTVIKTRMMAMDGANGLGGASGTPSGTPSGAAPGAATGATSGVPASTGAASRVAGRGATNSVLETAREVVRTSGYRGLYKGFGTVVGGLIPGRMLYLGVLEATKKSVSVGLGESERMSEAAVASVSSFVAGATASLAGQMIAVPVDVVSQRQMIDRGTSGLRIAKSIVAKRGFSGLYQGLGASIITFVPSSAIWWSAYGAYQSLLWSAVDSYRGVAHATMHDAVRSEGEILMVQIASGVVTGCTTSFLTNPLDVIKTRVQVREGGHVSWMGTARDLYGREGMRGFFRGVLPRMASASLWGTTMVNAYELLKRRSCH
jgi:solute carrier family 25 protein 44